MNRFQFSTPRALFALTAPAMTAITIGALIVLPAKLDSATAVPDLVANAIAATNPFVHGSDEPACAGEPEAVDRRARSGVSAATRFAHAAGATR